MANPIKKCVLHGAVNNETVDLYPRTNLASVSDMTAFARTLNGAADAAAARNTLGITTQAALINIIYPVGSVITLTNDTDPNKIYSGTTWVKMDAGRVLVSAGTYTEGSDTYTYALGSKGGEAKHQLTVEEIPSHNHQGSISTTSLSGEAWGNGFWNPDSPGANGVFSKGANNHQSTNTVNSWSAPSLKINANIAGSLSISATGGNAKHNNTQPYEVVFRWERKA